jgi:EAL domain.
MPDALTREELLLEFLRKLEPQRSGQRSAHVALSRLSPLSRRQSCLRLACEGLSRLAKSRKGQLFQLVNEDLLYFYDASEETEVRTEISRLRLLFADDPLMHDVEQAADFGRIYDLAEEFRDVVRLVRGKAAPHAMLMPSNDNGIKDRLKRRDSKRPPVPTHLLPKLEAALARTDLSGFVRRQPVCRLSPGGPPKHMFTDLSISLEALSEAVVPTFDLAADRCVARYLAERLDRRLLSMLLHHEHQMLRERLSIPLTLSTLLSESFRYFDDQVSISRRGSIVLKLRLADIFSDLETARFAFRLARHRGYRTLVSGIMPTALPLLTFEGLGVDFVRCEGNRALFVDTDLVEQLSVASTRMAPSQFVLAGIHSREALELGINAGFEFFQGLYLDNALRDAKRWRRLHLVPDHGHGRKSA